MFVSFFSCQLTSQRSFRDSIREYAWQESNGISVATIRTTAFYYNVDVGGAYGRRMTRLAIDGIGVWVRHNQRVRRFVPGERSLGIMNGLRLMNWERATSEARSAHDDEQYRQQGGTLTSYS